MPQVADLLLSALRSGTDAEARLILEHLLTGEFKIVVVNSLNPNELATAITNALGGI